MMILVMTFNIQLQDIHNSLNVAQNVLPDLVAVPVTHLPIWPVHAVSCVTTQMEHCIV